MGLNIKNEETHRLVQELATLTGESMTAAVTEAVRERLNRVRRARGTSLADRLITIGKGSSFLMCQHPDLPKYPRQPVAACPGFTAARTSES